jgi:archaellum component FlaC
MSSITNGPAGDGAVAPVISRGSSTRELTRQAADQLLLRDPKLAPEKITVDKIYAVIQQGSRTTINGELKAWRADKSKPCMPKELLDLWDDAVQRAQELFAQDRERMEGEVSAAIRHADELNTDNGSLRREAESKECLLKEKFDEAENLQRQLTALKNETEVNREIARVSQEAAERSLIAMRDRVETAERAAREATGSLASQRLEYARLEAELRQEFRHASDRQAALIEKLRMDSAQSGAVSRELDNHLGAARARSESLSHEINKLNDESTQLKASLAGARTEIEASNRELRDVTGAHHCAEIEVTRTQTILQAKEEALQVEITRRINAENSVEELRAQLRGLSQNT